MSILPENLDKARNEVRRLERLRDIYKKAENHQPSIYFCGAEADLDETIREDIRALALEGLRIKIAASVELLAWYGVDVSGEAVPAVDHEALADVSALFRPHLDEVERAGRRALALMLAGHPAAALLDARD